MTLDLPTTLAILAAGLGLFGYALWQVRKPPDPLRSRMINYHFVQFVAIMVVVLMGAHILTLFKGVFG